MVVHPCPAVTKFVITVVVFVEPFNSQAGRNQRAAHTARPPELVQLLRDLDALFGRSVTELSL